MLAHERRWRNPLSLWPDDDAGPDLAASACHACRRIELPHRCMPYPLTPYFPQRLVGGRSLAIRALAACADDQRAGHAELSGRECLGAMAGNGDGPGRHHSAHLDGLGTSRVHDHGGRSERRLPRARHRRGPARPRRYGTRPIGIVVLDHDGRHPARLELAADTDSATQGTRAPTCGPPWPRCPPSYSPARALRCS